MTVNAAVLFSIIVPTRGRPDGLRRLLDSFKSTTACLDTLEVILVVDADDNQTLEFGYTGFPLKRIVVQPGLSMGALNMAGYEAATGDYLMLLNDDVIVRTQGWDEKILATFKTFADGIVLVHVNDKIFEEKLCTFPFLSRSYCELADGICPSDYLRYRIDDHIYSVFNLLAVLGKIRILYLPEVVFEHTNFVLNSNNGAEYRPDERIHAIDTKRFHELLPERKNLALRLIDHIDRQSRADQCRIRQNLLNQVTDSVALRRPEYVRVRSDIKLLSSENTRVTIGVVSANLKSDHARTCIDFIKKFTKNFDLVVLDNNRSSTFNHPHEMNKLLSTCDTDFLVLMDDDVFVEPGWLDGMLRCMAPSVGVVTPLHKDRSGNLSYAGVVMRPDYSGHHTHSLNPPERSSRIQTLCSAILLIDMTKCGHIRFDESYSKYFLDIDYGFQVWSAGYEVVCSPYSSVTHIGGATLKQGSALSNDLFEVQRQHFVREWVETRRYRQLEQGIWSNVPEIQGLLRIAPDVDALLTHADEDRELFRERALALFRSIKNYPALAHWAAQRICDAVGSNRPTVDDSELGHLGFLFGCIPNAVPIEQNFDGLDIVLYNADYFAIPETEGGFDYDRFVKGDYTRSCQAESVDVLKARICADVFDVPEVPDTPDIPDVVPIEPKLRDPVLIEQNGDGLNIILFGDHYYAIPQGEGAFDHDRILKGEYSRSYSAESLDEIKTRIRADGSLGIWRKLKIERARSGSWKGALQPFTRRVVKRGITSIFGVKTFIRIRGSYPGEQKSLAGAGDPQRWLRVSPITLVEADYGGYAIYRFEYKFFAVTQTAGSFSYEDFRQGNYNSHLIGHSLSEVHAGIDRLRRSKQAKGPSRGLLFACLPPLQLKPLLDLSDSRSSMTLLVEKSCKNDWEGYDTIVVDRGRIADWARTQNSSAADLLRQRLLNENFDRIIIPWSFPETWSDNSLEMAAAQLSKCIEVLHASGERRLYQGENLHRLTYNKAYLASMFQVVPPPHGQTVLEAGCSDGLVCDILALSGAHKVVGIDVMETVGCGFPHERIDYRVMNVAQMDFPDQSFDLVYSIATFEHLPKPFQALLEMLRVTKVGGYGYVQAGPLYHSPFGHHMFGYFQDCPWIHLRKSKEQIIAHAKAGGIDKVIQGNLAMTCEQYVTGMLNADHVNGLLLKEYRLKEFSERDDIEILKFNISYEGRELLTPEIEAEIPWVDTSCLAEHGFEIAFRRIR